MATETASATPFQVIPVPPPPANAPGLYNAQLKHIPLPNEFEITSPPATSHSRATPESFQSTGTADHDQNAEPEDEYTLSAYGDIAEDEVIDPPSPDPALLGNPSPLQSRFPQPRLRLRVRRPPMPKRRMSHTYFPDLKFYAGVKDRDERWPGSPSPAVKIQPRLQHQPLASPIRDHTTTPKSQKKEKKSTKKSGSSLEKLCDELFPRSPSIRLSPPGSPANQVVSLPQETREQKDVQKGQNQRAREADKAAKPSNHRRDLLLTRINPSQGPGEQDSLLDSRFQSGICKWRARLYFSGDD